MPQMLTNSQVKYIQSLARRKARREHGCFVAEGPRLIDEMLNSALQVDLLLHLPSWHHALMSRATNCMVIDERSMGRISGLTTPSEVLAVVRIPQPEPLRKPKGLILALDEVQDPGNLGTIIRLADWFGIERILCTPNTADAFSPKVVQASMGAIARVQLSYTPLTEILPQLKVPIYGTFMHGSSVYSTPVELPAVVVMGNEGNGISAEVERLIDGRLHIPSFNTSGATVESLNVGVATAIVCSEVLGRTMRG